MAYPFQKRKTAKQRNFCGFEAGWKVHKRYKEKSCRPCNDAHNQWLNEQKLIRRAELRLRPFTPLTRKNMNKALGRDQDPHVNRIAAIKFKAKERADRLEEAKDAGVRLPHVQRKSCDVEAGYQAHSVNYEEFCESSRLAHNTYSRDARRKPQKSDKRA